MNKIFRRLLVIHHFLIITGFTLCAQLKWENIDSLYQPLPPSVHIYKTTSSLDGKPNIAYYLIADLKDKQLIFDTDTTFSRRLTPAAFYHKNEQPLVVVNCTFFSFQTNQNLNMVIKNGKLVGYNVHTIAGRGKDTLRYIHTFGSAIGISKKRKADVAWTFTDSSKNFSYATGLAYPVIKDSSNDLTFSMIKAMKYFTPDFSFSRKMFRKWKMQTAVGGGPILLQNGEIKITNNEERKFAGNAIHDKHPRTAMGYTRDNQLIILVVQGRAPGIAEGASLTQEAQILKDLGCWEALNLDGGGSSCLLVNGKETIRPSDATGQRPVPAVFLIHHKEITNK